MMMTTDGGVFASRGRSEGWESCQGGGEDDDDDDDGDDGEHDDDYDDDDDDDHIW